MDTLYGIKSITRNISRYNNSFHQNIVFIHLQKYYQIYYQNLKQRNVIKCSLSKKVLFF